MRKLSIAILGIFFTGCSLMVANGQIARAAGASADFGVPAEAVNHFLFHVNDKLKSEIQALGPDKVMELRIPVLLGVATSDITDTWGEARANGRTHEGTDIMAPRGAYVVSPTIAVVTNIGYDTLGGNFVIAAVPGGEQFYFAHLTSAANNLKPGTILSPGDLIGYVGNTGDARGRATHLHFGIYYEGVATNPFPRLTASFSTAERLAALANIVNKSNTGFIAALDILKKQKSLFSEAAAEGVAVPSVFTGLMSRSDVLAAAETLRSGIVYGADNAHVRMLQSFLITEAAGPAARALARVGASGYFGSLTRRAVAEFQAASGIAPAAGYFGPITQSKVIASMLDKSLAAGGQTSQLSVQP